MSADDGQAILDTFVYKECNSNVELVVGRKFRLYSHKFCTYHNPSDPKDKKSWQLHRNCTLSPKSSQAITQQRKLIRPQGMSSIGATFKGAGQPITLVCSSSRSFVAMYYRHSCCPLSWPTTALKRQTLPAYIILLPLSCLMTIKLPSDLPCADALQAGCFMPGSCLLDS